MRRVGWVLVPFILLEGSVSTESYCYYASLCINYALRQGCRVPPKRPYGIYENTAIYSLQTRTRHNNKCTCDTWGMLGYQYLKRGLVACKHINHSQNRIAGPAIWATSLNYVLERHCYVVPTGLVSERMPGGSDPTKYFTNSLNIHTKLHLS